jgi:hypothetical protein
MEAYMRAWLDENDDAVRRGIPANSEGRYLATLKALDQAATTLEAGLKDARTAPQFRRIGILNDLHQRVRGMGLLLNDALGEFAAAIEEPRRSS